MTPKQRLILRTRLGLSQMALGAHVSMTKTSVYMWGSGRTPIPRWLKFAVKVMRVKEKA